MQFAGGMTNLSGMPRSIGLRYVTPSPFDGWGIIGLVEPITWVAWGSLNDKYMSNC